MKTMFKQTLLASALAAVMMANANAEVGFISVGPDAREVGSSLPQQPQFKTPALTMKVVDGERKAEDTPRFYVKSLKDFEQALNKGDIDGALSQVSKTPLNKQPERAEVRQPSTIVASTERQVSPRMVSPERLAPAHYVNHRHVDMLNETYRQLMQGAEQERPAQPRVEQPRFSHEAQDFAMRPAQGQRFNVQPFGNERNDDRIVRQFEERRQPQHFANFEPQAQPRFEQDAPRFERKEQFAPKQYSFEGQRFEKAPEFVQHADFSGKFDNRAPRNNIEDIEAGKRLEAIKEQFKGLESEMFSKIEQNYRAGKDINQAVGLLEDMQNINEEYENVVADFHKGKRQARLDLENVEKAFAKEEAAIREKAQQELNQRLSLLAKEKDKRIAEIQTEANEAREDFVRFLDQSKEARHEIINDFKRAFDGEAKENRDVRY